MYSFQIDIKVPAFLIAPVVCLILQILHKLFSYI